MISYRTNIRRCRRVSNWHRRLYLYSIVLSLWLIIIIICTSLICVSSATQHSIIDQPYEEDGNTCNTQIIRKNTDGSITLYEQTYPISSSNQYGYKVSRSLNKIQKHAPLITGLFFQYQTTTFNNEFCV